MYLNALQLGAALGSLIAIVSLVGSHVIVHRMSDASVRRWGRILRVK